MSQPSIRLRLRVAPGVARCAVVGRYDGGWKVRVDAAPSAGRANRSLVAYLAGVLGVDRDSLRIASGAAGRDKTIVITGLDAVAADAAQTVAAGERGGQGER